MIDPAGPLPPAVYLRRRMIAVAMTIVAVLVLAWIVGRLVGALDDQPVRGASAHASRPQVSPPPAGSPSSSVSPVGSPLSPPSPLPSVQAQQAQQAQQPPPAQPVPPPPPVPPQACPDAVMQVAAEVAQPSYRIGQRPQLRLVIANSGASACVRDLSRTLRELVITSGDGASRLWSSNDCYAPPGVDSRVLGPAERLTFTVSWAGRTSAPGCPSRRRTLPAGAYLVTPRLGGLTGPPVPLELTR